MKAFIHGNKNMTIYADNSRGEKKTKNSTFASRNPLHTLKDLFCLDMAILSITNAF